jgi:hypothetical protein
MRFNAERKWIFRHWKPRNNVRGLKWRLNCCVEWHKNDCLGKYSWFIEQFSYFSQLSFFHLFLSNNWHFSERFVCGFQIRELTVILVNWRDELFVWWDWMWKNAESDMWYKTRDRWHGIWNEIKFRWKLMWWLLKELSNSDHVLKIADRTFKNWLHKSAFLSNRFHSSFVALQWANPSLPKIKMDGIQCQMIC